MRTDADCDLFLADMIIAYPEKKARFFAECYRAGVPRSFWTVTGGRIEENRPVFEAIVLRYCQKWRKAYKRGYGLIFTGDNGAGKSIKMAFVLTQMMRRGRSVYYTSLAQLDVDLKKCFKDPLFERQLEERLSSDFVAIDELGKEHVKNDSYLRARFELLLKSRYDGGDPTLLASNLDYSDLCSHYGSSITSMFDGKYEHVPLLCNDFRENDAKRMRKQMGYAE